MPRIPLLAVSLGTGFLLTAPAFAANGETTGPSTMYDGPGFEYGEIVQVPAGTRLVNHGCVNVEEWCRVRWGKHRGWIGGEFLAQVHAKGATLVAAFPRPPAAPAIDETDEDGYIHSGAGYYLPHGKKFGHGRRGGKRSASASGYGKHISLKPGPRGYLKLKPRGFLKLKPRGFLKLGH